MFKLLASVALIAAFVVPSYLITTHVEDATITVRSKERLLRVSSTKDGTRAYYQNFVYTDAEAYTVDDSLFNGHFTSGTVYAQLREGATCKVRLAGYRFGFFSMYQNIISAECN